MSFHCEWPRSQSAEIRLPVSILLLLHIYNAFLTISWPFLFVYLRLRAALDGKYARSYRQRLGIELPRFGSVQRAATTQHSVIPAKAGIQDSQSLLDPGSHQGDGERGESTEFLNTPFGKSRDTVWFHALSVGEVLSVVPLVKAVKELYPSIEVAFSTSTETGQATARSRLTQRADHFFHMPLDFPWAVKRLISNLNPSLFILTETDIWPNVLSCLKKREIPCFLVNGRISPRSFGRLIHFKQFTEPMFSLLDGVFAQSNEDKMRYEQLGIPPDRVAMVGNLKVDSVLPPLTETEVMELGRSIGVEPGRPLWIAGSTHEGEEEVLLQVHAMLRSQNPDVLLIIAPRDVRRADGLASLCARRGAPAARRSLSEDATGKPVYILDTLGELSRFYALASIAFIGGSLVPFGGHNPLEVVSQGKFAVWGPNLFNFGQIEAALTDAHCGSRILSAEELGEVVCRFVSDPELRDFACERARRFMQTQEGPAKTIARMVVRRMKGSSEGG